MAEDLDWEKHLELNRRPRQLGGIGVMCSRARCPKHQRTRWYFTYEGEPFNSADKRREADGWIAVREHGQDDDAWGQVYGWFCSPECLWSDEGDRCRRAATEALNHRLRLSSQTTRRATPASMRWYRRFWRWLMRSAV